MSYTIKFGTDGWREIIAKDYTVANVYRVADGTALWLLKEGHPQIAVIGHDCRFGGKMFLEATAQSLANHGITCFISDKFVSTPAVSLAASQLQAGVGIVITASHNPPEYNGFKIKASYGGPASPAEIEKIQELIPDVAPLFSKSFDECCEEGLIKYHDFERAYIEAVENTFDMKLLRSQKYQWAYDAMYGAGQDVVRHLLPDATFLHCDYNPGFDGQAPEPIHKNLQEFSQLIEMAGDIDSGLATDGDADRIGLYNQAGEFVDSHHIILLLISYLHKHQGLNGKVVTSFSCTGKIKKLCELYGLEHETTKIGFKYICDIMVTSDVLLGGEESGGIAIKGHIPERDGVWIGLVIWEYMAKTGKSLNELISEIYDLVGSFAVERYDLHISETDKARIIAACESNEYNAFGKYQVSGLDTLDGFKFSLENDAWVMIRPSGTEPVLRVYAEAATKDEAFRILDATKLAILG
ncbi:MAG: phosphomannomutase [Bacteroidia bacterium]|jgi:phosphomannomutase